LGGIDPADFGISGECGQMAESEIDQAIAGGDDFSAAVAHGNIAFGRGLARGLVIGAAVGREQGTPARNAHAGFAIKEVPVLEPNGFFGFDAHFAVAEADLAGKHVLSPAAETFEPVRAFHDERRVPFIVRRQGGGGAAESHASGDQAAIVSEPREAFHGASPAVSPPGAGAAPGIGPGGALSESAGMGIVPERACLEVSFSEASIRSPTF